MAVGIAWNAGALRGRLLGLHRLGGDACRDLARSDSFADALSTLRDGPYGHDVEADMTLRAAQWATAATPLWNLRVLAGWLPPSGAEEVRVLAGWWEALDVESLLARLEGAPALPPYDLGRLDTAWDRLRSAESAGVVRQRMAASPWLDPGAEDPGSIVTWLRISWAQRVYDEIGVAARLASARAALVVAQDMFVDAGTLAERRARGLRLLGVAWPDAEDLASLRDRLPRDAAWILEGISAPTDLWRAEVRWWRTLDAEARGWLSHPGSGTEAVLGAFGVLLADARRVQAALELAARGASGEEEVDEVL